MIKDTAAIDDAIKQLKLNALILKVNNTLTDYLSCNIFSTSMKLKLGFVTPHLIQISKQKVGDMVT